MLSKPVLYVGRPSRAKVMPVYLGGYFPMFFPNKLKSEERNGRVTYMVRERAAVAKEIDRLRAKEERFKLLGYGNQDAAGL